MDNTQIKLSNINTSYAPSNLEAEQVVIGSLLVNNDLIDEVSNIISEEKFYDPIHQKIYSVINNLHNKGMVANPITLKNYFENNNSLNEIGGNEYISKITKLSASSRQTIDYAKIIHDTFIRRELIKVSDELEYNAKDDNQEISSEKIIENTERVLFDLAERGNFTKSILSFNQALDQSIEMAKQAMKSENAIVGVPTGLKDLDEKLGGLHKSDLIIIAGRPSMGKTALATNIAYHASKKLLDDKKNSSIAFFSLEMSSEQLSTRILSEQARVTSNNIRRGKATQDEINKYIEVSRNIYDIPLFIDETPAITISTLSNRARRIKRLHGLDLIVVDYIQLMRTNNLKYDGNRVQEISEITQGLKALAKELSVPVLALSQLSRAVEQRDDKKPQLSDLRESGSIEQDADVVLFVFREEYYLEKKEPKPGSIEHAECQSKMSEISGLAEILIGKQRHGPTGNIKVEFEGMFTKFKDLTTN